MSLNITIAAPWGIWQCSDHRLTDPRTRQLVDDTSVKHVALCCPDGTGLLAYAGIGRVNGVCISDWVREVLRGTTRSLDESLIYLREQAMESIGPIAAKDNYWHMFTIGAFLQGQPWVAQIRNFESRSPWSIGPVLAKFVTAVMQIKNEPQVFVWGVREAVLPKEFRKLREIIKNRPHRPDDYHGLLAKINTKAATHPEYGSLISSACITSYLPPAGFPISSKHHGERLEQAIPLTIPTIFRGIDTTDTESLLKMKLLKTPKDDELGGENTFQEKLEEVARRSVMPDNRLRRKR